MTPKEMAVLVKKIQIRTGKLVHEVFAGQYESVFKGHGMEFSEVREYAPGDDVRAIDRNVTARLGKPYIKKYVEERELTVMLVVDLSRSSRFGTQERFKRELLAELSGLLAFTAVRNQDKVGFLSFADQVIQYLPPKKGLSHALVIVRDILADREIGPGSRLHTALQYLNSVLKRRAVVFILSDFFLEGHDQALKITASHHDVIAVRLTDPRETEWPAVGLVDFEDRETGARVLVDTSDPAVRASFTEEARRRHRSFDALMKSAGTDSIELTTGASFIPPLIRFFKEREKRFR